ncbi:PaaX family transcriptional regulator [Streptomyces marispadix]|uniref:PaaX family transcriptional regulator n=1 Tax=Streptomyces marispadix TaxID=2922868 RepID=A0ABS9SUC6_9ACTN|nr:PaaX family transcriptional regulator C-terminal domain-containing protein [Streptomyces marispadix]MCH6159872.1 PaaX family transcriptional regulator [Streptomyces marispadix]
MTPSSSDRPDDTLRASAIRPQSLMFSFFGIHVLGRGTGVYSGSVIDVFARAGVGEEAVRSTLARMAKRGLLVRHRRGRKVYFGLTAHAEGVLQDGHRRIWETGAVNRDWDGTWTLVGFSLPDSRRRERHGLRSRLLWEGFGPLQSGLWIAAGEKDAPSILDPLGLDEHVTVLKAQAFKPTEAADLVRKAFDISAIADGYRDFLQRWNTAPRPPLSSLPDDLTRQLTLHTDWLRLVRQDPHLPAEHLPGDWPAIRAENCFRTLARTYEPVAARLADEALDVIALG